MKNFIQRGKTLTVPAPTGGVLSGDPVQVGVLFGVAAYDAAEGLDVAIDTEGVFSLPKATGETWAIGDPLYWDASARNFTKTAGDSLRAGAATAVAGSSDVLGNVRIGAAGVDLNGLTAPQAASPDLVAITGGESPTEAEHNAMLGKVNSILAALRAANIIAD